MHTIGDSCYLLVLVLMATKTTKLLNASNGTNLQQIVNVRRYKPTRNRQKQMENKNTFEKTLFLRSKYLLLLFSFYFFLLPLISYIHQHNGTNSTIRNNTKYSISVTNSVERIFHQSLYLTIFWSFTINFKSHRDWKFFTAFWINSLF